MTKHRRQQKWQWQPWQQPCFIAIPLSFVTTTCLFGKCVLEIRKMKNKKNEKWEKQIIFNFSNSVNLFVYLFSFCFSWFLLADIFNLIVILTQIFIMPLFVCLFGSAYCFVFAFGVILFVCFIFVLFFVCFCFVLFFVLFVVFFF